MSTSMDYLKKLLPIPIGLRSKKATNQPNRNKDTNGKNPSAEAMAQKKIRNLDLWLDSLDISMPGPPADYTLEQAILDLENGVNSVLLESAFASSGTGDSKRRVLESDNTNSWDDSFDKFLLDTDSSDTLDGKKSAPSSGRSKSSGSSSSGTLSSATLDGEKTATGSAKTSDRSDSMAPSSRTVSSGTIDGEEAAPGSSKSDSSLTVSSATLGFSPRTEVSHWVTAQKKEFKSDDRIADKEAEQQQQQQQSTLTDNQSQQGKSAGSAKDSQPFKTPSPEEEWSATRQQRAAAQAAAAAAVAEVTETAPDDEARRARRGTRSLATPSTRTRPTVSTKKSLTGFHRRGRWSDTQAHDAEERFASFPREPERMSQVVTVWSVFYVVYALIDARDRAIRNNWSTGTSYYDVSSDMHCAMIFSSVTQVILLTLAMLRLTQKVSPTTRGRSGWERLDRLDQWLASMVWWK
ncbi:hypothetical protein B0T22DRAFT_539304 [Podospora appendiculata]|uniref:Uncharacterized protein n=1 Tax=Podospora appendiculata TaxID=314037 RepID=A0AAE0X094_9PEZI|nr:hypothetical protein B0T22DRAFT_539304 [Podospora appendiculata]